MSEAPNGIDLDELAAILDRRKGADPDVSYVARLHRDGLDAMLRKIAEESFELIMAAKEGDRGQLVHETADLWFHTLVLLSNRGLGPRDVLRELAHRSGISGLEEKAGRGKNS